MSDVEFEALFILSADFFFAKHIALKIIHNFVINLLNSNAKTKLLLSKSLKHFVRLLFHLMSNFFIAILCFVKAKNSDSSLIFVVKKNLKKLKIF